MALYTVANGGVTDALDVDQFYNLLTGTMTDQVVTVSNRIRAQASGAANGSGGFVGATASFGAPSSGTFVAGDFAFDANGVIWYCTAGGTPGTWRQQTPYRQVTELGSAAASVVLSSIPTTLKRITVSWAGKSDANVNTSLIFMRVNGSSAANYYGQKIDNANATTSSSNFATQTWAEIGTIAGQPAGVGTQWGVGTVDISGWDLASSVADRLTWTARCGTYRQAADSHLALYDGTYITAGPWTSLTFIPFSGNFATGSQFVLEGWA